MGGLLLTTVTEICHPCVIHAKLVHVNNCIEKLIVSPSHSFLLLVYVTLGNFFILNYGTLIQVYYYCRHMCRISRLLFI